MVLGMGAATVAEYLFRIARAIFMVPDALRRNWLDQWKVDEPPGDLRGEDYDPPELPPPFY